MSDGFFSAGGTDLPPSSSFAINTARSRRSGQAPRRVLSALTASAQQPDANEPKPQTPRGSSGRAHQQQPSLKSMLQQQQDDLFGPRSSGPPQPQPPRQHASSTGAATATRHDKQRQHDRDDDDLDAFLHDGPQPPAPPPRHNTSNINAVEEHYSRQQRMVPSPDTLISLARREDQDPTGRSKRAMLEELVERDAAKIRVKRIPVDLWIVAFSFLPLRDLVKVSAVSRRFHVAANTPLLWKRIHSLLHLIDNENNHNNGSRGGGNDDDEEDDHAPDSPPRWSVTAEEPINRSNKANKKHSGSNNYKAQVKNYVMHRSQTITTALNHVENNYRNATRRLDERIEQLAPFTQSHAAELEETQPKLKTLLKSCEEQLNAMRQKVLQLEVDQGQVARGVSSNRVSLQAAQAQIKNAMRCHTTLRGELVDAAKLAQFERTTVHLVMRPLANLPVVLRRGVGSFSEMELLCLQLQPSELHNRWNRVKNTLPIDEHYFAVRDEITGFASLVKQQQQQTGGGQAVNGASFRTPAPDGHAPLAPPRRGGNKISAILETERGRRNGSALSSSEPAPSPQLQLQGRAGGGGGTNTAAATADAATLRQDVVRRLLFDLVNKGEHQLKQYFGL